MRKLRLREFTSSNRKEDRKAKLPFSLENSFC
jgi:hypothetical protein